MEKFERHNINFTCAFCVLGLKATETPTQQNLHPEDLSILTKKVDQLIEVSLTHKESSSFEQSSEKVTGGVSPENIVIIDNLQSPRDYKHSVSIVKELSNHQTVAKQCDLAYSLPQGGIAIHLKSDSNSSDFIQKWPQKAFGGNTSAHQCREFTKTNSWSAFVKNIPTTLTITCIRDSLHQTGIASSSIRRVRFHDSKKPAYASDKANI